MRRDDIAYLTACAGSLVALATLGPLRRRIEMVGEDDLSRIWAGPRAVLIGADPYDPATWAATAVALGTQLPDTPVYIYPPWVTLALLPLGALPLPVVSAFWLVAGLALAIVALRATLQALLPGRPLEHAVAAVALLLSWVGMLNLIIGQWGHALIAALFAVVLALRGGRPGLAGLAAVGFIVKPQLFVLTAPALAIRALWPEAGRAPARAGVRFLVTAAGVAAALVAVSWILLPSWWPAWPQLVAGRQIQPDADTIPALLRTLAGPAGLAVAPIAILALMAVALRFHPLSDGWIPVWTALSIAAAPYANSYDQVLLAVPIVLAAGALHPTSPRASRVVLLAGAVVLLVLTPAMYEVALRRRSESLGAIVPLAVFAIVTASLWRGHRARSTLHAR